MKTEYGVIISGCLLVSASLGLIANHPDEIPYWNYLHEMKQQVFADGCDIDCKKEQEKRGFLCVSLDSEQYICRPPRNIVFPEQEVPIMTVFPPTFGEFAYFSDNVEIAKERIFDIAKATIVNKETKEIQVEFRPHRPVTADNDFEYRTTLYLGDTFVSHCLGGDSKTAHVVEYRDVFALDGITYVEFWGTHVTMPEQLLPCKMPELIQHSIPIDLRLGVDFGEER